MAMAVDHHLDIALAVVAEPASPAAIVVAPAARQRRVAPVDALSCGRRRAGPAAVDDAAAGEGSAAERKPRRGGWLRRLVPRQHALRRRWKLLSGAPSRLAAGLPRCKRVPGLSVGGGWASELLDAAAFRVMYVVEAVVLGLALSCFFCCCGCQI